LACCGCDEFFHNLRYIPPRFIIKFDDGRLITVTQAGDEKFQPGDRVRVLTGSGVTRISH